MTGCIFVTGIWKSGNHLVYAALNELGVPGPFNGISGHLLQGSNAWVKRLVRGAFSAADTLQVGLEIDAPVSRRYLQRTVRALSGKILGGHAAHSPELEALLQVAGTRMICIRRDPRDILVSFADWIGTRPDYYLHGYFVDLCRNARIARLLEGGQLARHRLQPFPEVLRRAEGWLRAPDVLEVAFEDLIGHAGGGSDAAQQEAVARLHAHVGIARPLSGVEAGRIYGNTRTFNQGRLQRWREIDDQGLIAEIQAALAPRLASWGYAQ